MILLITLGPCIPSNKQLKTRAKWTFVWMILDLEDHGWSIPSYNHWTKAECGYQWLNVCWTKQSTQDNPLQPINTWRLALKNSFPGGLDPAAPRQVFLFRGINLSDFHGGNFMSGQEDPNCYSHRNCPRLKSDTIYGPMSTTKSGGSCGGAVNTIKAHVSPSHRQGLEGRKLRYLYSKSFSSCKIIFCTCWNI
jgi:hypothetical protein